MFPFMRGIQPSLRDLCHRRFEPGRELPGYSRISLGETEAVKMSKLQRGLSQPAARRARGHVG